ncbi:MAG: thermonuclease family protein [Candidatus Omnitrophica bacterium]|nr:thermonuclease family protein [Candidatus Omnitrophota bacterium]
MKNFYKITLFILTFFCWCLSVQADLLSPGYSKYQDVVVERVLNITMIKLETGEKIKLIGLKPERAIRRDTRDIKVDANGFVVEPPADAVVPVEEQAINYLRDMLEGKHVRIEFDTQKKDEDLMTLGYVFLIKDNLFVNADILRNGYAFLQVRVPNTKFNEELRGAAQEAKREKRGLQGQ